MLDMVFGVECRLRFLRGVLGVLVFLLTASCADANMGPGSLDVHPFLKSFCPNADSPSQDCSNAWQVAWHHPPLINRSADASCIVVDENTSKVVTQPIVVNSSAIHAAVLSALSSTVASCRNKSRAHCLDNCEWSDKTSRCDISAALAVAMLARDVGKPAASSGQIPPGNLPEWRLQPQLWTENITKKQLAQISASCGTFPKDSCANHFSSVCAWDPDAGKCVVNPVLAVRAIAENMGASGARRLAVPSESSIVTSVKWDGDWPHACLVSNFTKVPFALSCYTTLIVERAIFNGIPGPCLYRKDQIHFWVPTEHLRPSRRYHLYCTSGNSTDGVAHVSFIHVPNDHSGNATIAGNTSNRSNCTNQTLTKPRPSLMALSPVVVLAIFVVVLGTLWVVKGTITGRSKRTLGLMGGSDYELPEGSSTNASFAEAQSMRWIQLQGGPA